MAGLALFVLPWLNVDLRVAMPAQAMARFFSETFERRVGAPLQIVAGDPRTAALIALGAPSRPSDTAGALPAAIKERFPELVPEVPRVFERSVQGRLPLVRIGWGFIRPQSEDKPRTTEGGGQKKNP
jgi:hypothetical protein